MSEEGRTAEGTISGADLAMFLEKDSSEAYTGSDSSGRIRSPEQAERHSEDLEGEPEDSPEAEDEPQAEEQAEEGQSDEDQAADDGTPGEAAELPEFLRGTPFKDGEAAVKAWREATAAMTPVQQRAKALEAEVEQLRSHVTQTQSRQLAALRFDDLDPAQQQAYEAEAEASDYELTARQLFALEKRQVMQQQAQEQTQMQQQAEQANQTAVQTFEQGLQQSEMYHQFMTEVPQEAEQLRTDAQGFLEVVRTILPAESAGFLAAKLVHLATMERRLPAMQQAWETLGREKAEKRLAGVKGGRPVGARPGIKPNSARPTREPASERDDTLEYAKHFGIS